MKNDTKIESIKNCCIGSLLLGSSQMFFLLTNIEEYIQKESITSNIQDLLYLIIVIKFVILTIIGSIIFIKGIYLLTLANNFETTEEEDESLKTLIQNKENKKEIISKIHNLTKKEMKELIAKEKLNKIESDLLLSFYEEEYENLLKEEKILKNKIKEKKIKMGIKSTEIKMY